MFSKSSLHKSLEVFGRPDDQVLIRHNGLVSFDTLWSLDAEWVEAPNYRREGWSGVVRTELSNVTGPPTAIYLKRQSGHCYRSLRPPFHRKPTAYREYRNLMVMKARAINAPDVLYYGERLQNGAWQAILMTREIPQSISLAAYLQKSGQRPPDEVRRVIAETAALIGKLHRAGLQHSALYGKHILVSGVDRPQGGVDRPYGLPVPFLIDCEKTRQRAFRWSSAIRDLNQLKRHAPWQAWQWQSFVARYLAAMGYGRTGFLMHRAIDRKALRKQGRHQRRHAASPTYIPVPALMSAPRPRQTAETRRKAM